MPLPKSIAVACILTMAGMATGCTMATNRTGSEVTSNGTMRTFEIAPRKVSCMGVAPMECLRIRRLPDANWELFYDSITGFEFEPGYTYVIEAIETQVDPVPADASSLAYRLQRIVSKRRTE